MKTVEIGAAMTGSIVVTEDKLANSVGSGEVSVYATPMMIALMEQVSASCLKPFLEENETSVGTSIQTSHTAATPCGMTVSVTAVITGVEGRKVAFSVAAKDEKEMIGEAVHERFVVLKQKFEARAISKLEQ